MAYIESLIAVDNITSCKDVNVLIKEYFIDKDMLNDCALSADITLEVLNYLVKCGVDMEILYMVVCRACQNGRLEIFGIKPIKKLLEVKSGSRLISIANEHNHNDMISYLIEAGVKIIYPYKEMGIAIRSKNKKMIGHLAETVMVDDLLLAAAIDTYDYSIVKYIINAPHKDIDIHNDYLLSKAKNCKNLGIIKLLHKNGMNILKVFDHINWKNDRMTHKYFKYILQHYTKQEYINECNHIYNAINNNNIKTFRAIIKSGYYTESVLYDITVSCKNQYILEFLTEHGINHFIKYKIASAGFNFINDIASNDNASILKYIDKSDLLDPKNDAIESAMDYDAFEMMDSIGIHWFDLLVKKNKLDIIGKYKSHNLRYFKSLCRQITDDRYYDIIVYNCIKYANIVGLKYILKNYLNDITYNYIICHAIDYIDRYPKSKYKPIINFIFNNLEYCGQLTSKYYSERAQWNEKIVKILACVGCYKIIKRLYKSGQLTTANIAKVIGYMMFNNGIKTQYEYNTFLYFWDIIDDYLDIYNGNGDPNIYMMIPNIIPIALIYVIQFDNLDRFKKLTGERYKNLNNLSVREYILSDNRYIDCCVKYDSFEIFKYILENCNDSHRLIESVRNHMALHNISNQISDYLDAIVHFKRVN